MKRKIILLGVPSDLGANRKGTSLAPNKIRKYLIPTLKRKKASFIDLGNIDVPKASANTNKKREHFKEIKNICINLRKMNPNAFKGNPLLIILGGDHSITFCNVKEISRKKTLGLIWLDAHGDFNTEKTSPSGNIHGMVLGEISGNSLKTLLDLKQAIIKEENISLLGVRALDEKEAILFIKSKIKVVTAKDFKKDIEGNMKKALRRANKGTKGYHISIDLDVVDPKYAPGVSTPVKKGISKTQLFKIIDTINTKKLVSIDFVEVNPKYDKKEKTAKLVASCISRLC